MSAEGELRVQSPGDLDAPARVRPWSLAAARLAVGRAREAQPGWEATARGERLGLLRSLRERFLANAPAFAELLGVEVGKPRWEGAQEAAFLAAKIDATIGEALRLVEPHRPEGIDGEWRYRAHGVLAVLGPFNFPVHLPNGHIVPALALGNCVVFKPSELAPELGELYGKCVREAGFPEGVFSVVQGERTVGAFLAEEAELDGVLFTGSLQVGSAIARANADRPGKILALELGGKNAALVFEDADLDRAAYQIAYGAYATAGQRCSSTSRCLVARALFEPLKARLAALARAARVGHPTDPQSFLGPLITAQALERFLADLKASGAEPLVPPQIAVVPGVRGHYLRPSLHAVREGHASARYRREELFGPDLALYAFESEDEAVALANDTPYGLCASVFTADRARFLRLAERLRAGVLNWNSPTVGASGKLPFGGIGASGNHRPAGVFSPFYCSWPAALSFGPSGPTPEQPAPGLG